MKLYLKEVVKRGLIGASIGPVLYGFIIYILYLCNLPLSLSAPAIFLSIFSTFIMGFAAGGTSVIPEIETISPLLQAVIHGSLLYVVYLSFCLINFWIPFHWLSILMFTGIFFFVFLFSWILTYFVILYQTKKLNQRLEEIHKKDSCC